MNKILIIKLGALGDMIMATSLIDQILEHHSNDELYLITVPQFRELFENQDRLNIKIFERKGFFNNWHIIRWIRLQQFNRLYDLQSNDRTGIWSAVSGIPERTGNHPRFPYNLHPETAYNGQCHIYERMLEVLRSAGISPRNSPPHLPVTESTTQKVRNWVTKHGLEAGAFVIIHAGASARHPEKCWPYYIQLANHLSENGYTIVWIGTDDDAELNARLSKIQGVDATNEFSIIELAELGRQARFAVTNDSGPMHILSCSGIPVYALFAPTNWQRNHAVGQKSFVIAPDDLQGNIFKPCPIGRISIAKVINRLQADQLL